MADNEKIGIVGVGRMGQAMTRHLIKHGYAVLAQDIEPKAEAAARDLGAETAKTPAEVGRACKFVIVAVGYDDEAEAVMLGQARPPANHGRGRGDRGVLHLHAGAREDAGREGAPKGRRGARRADLPRPDGGRHRHDDDAVRRQARGVRARQADLQRVQQGHRAARRRRRRPVSARR